MDFEREGAHRKTKKVLFRRSRSRSRDEEIGQELGSRWGGKKSNRGQEGRALGPARKTGAPFERARTLPPPLPGRGQVYKSERKLRTKQEREVYSRFLGGNSHYQKPAQNKRKAVEKQRAVVAARGALVGYGMLYRRR